jgi:hypothetical protein
MYLIMIAVIILCIIFLYWIIFIKKNNSKLQNHEMKDLEIIDTSDLYGCCYKDITHSSKLLKDLYGSEFNNKIHLHNKNDEVLYNTRWTTVNTCV